MTITLQQLQQQSHTLSRAKGWWDGRLDPADRSFVPEKLMLIVSECSEALESYRKNEPLNYYQGHGDECETDEDLGLSRGTCYTCKKPRKPEGIASELADVLIRVGDLAERLGIDLTRAVAEKHAYNETRSHKHGGKVC